MIDRAIGQLIVLGDWFTAFKMVLTANGKVLQTMLFKTLGIIEVAAVENHRVGERGFNFTKVWRPKGFPFSTDHQHIGPTEGRLFGTTEQ